ncbi:MAG TPA: flavin reductase family protein [Planctomycetota bacterium]|nr:flavin reductase family protein [Planctomycetota bacterium]
MKQSLGAKTLLVPTPVWIVGTYDAKGKANAAAVAWGGICCSKPPCVAVSLRAATQTHGNILARKAFTVNVPSVAHAKEADYFGLASGRDVDKFAATGLTPVKSDLVDAPYIAEFPLVAECKLYKVVELGLHTQFVGEIMDVKADASVVDGESADIERVKPFVYNTHRRVYYAIGGVVGPAFEMGKSVGG